MLTREQGAECVLRVRVSHGWRISKYFGHMGVRGRDLLQVPNCHSNYTFSVTIDVDPEVAKEEMRNSGAQIGNQNQGVADKVCCIQSALLYSDAETGERRFRVILINNNINII